MGDAHAEWGESRENCRNGYRIWTGTPAAAPSRCASQSCGEAARSCSGVTNVTTRRSSGPRRGSRRSVRSGSTTWSNSGSTSICALVAQTRSSPPFALDRLREHDPQHLLYECTKPGLGRTGPLRLTPLEPLDRLAALILPPHVHRHRYPRVLTRTAAHRRFPRRPGAAAHGRLPRLTLFAQSGGWQARRSPRRLTPGPDREGEQPANRRHLDDVANPPESGQDSKRNADALTLFSQRRLGCRSASPRLRWGNCDRARQMLAHLR